MHKLILQLQLLPEEQRLSKERILEGLLTREAQRKATGELFWNKL